MWIRIMARNGHQRALNQLNKCFFAYFICGTALTIWKIVTEAIYNVRELDKCPRTFETHFSTKLHYSILEIAQSNDN